MQGIAVQAVDISECGVADADSLLQQSGKHRFKCARRPADNLEHLRSRHQLLQRLVPLAGKPRDLGRVSRSRTANGYGLECLATLQLQRLAG